MERSTIDVASGGALMDKTPTTTKHLISNMASNNTQQFGIIGAGQPRMHQLSITARVCCICTSMEHPTNMCPMLQETKSDHPESIGAISCYQYEKQPYQSRHFDNQYGKHPFRPRPSQGPYAAQRFGLVPNVRQAQSGYRPPNLQY
ncbi:hypothetical protein CR513_39062, partial [Mucuna pruriens]